MVRDRILAVALFVAAVLLPFWIKDMPESVAALGVILAVLIGGLSLTSYVSEKRLWEISKISALIFCAYAIGALSYQRREAPPVERGLSALTKVQLKEAAISYAAKMRTFESNADTARQSRWVFSEPGLSQEERTRRFNERIQQDTQSMANKQLEFANNYLPTARQLREELIRRLQSEGVFPPYGYSPSPIDKRAEQRGESAIVTGQLYGAYPIKDAADFIDLLARRLSP